MKSESRAGFDVVVLTLLLACSTAAREASAQAVPVALAKPPEAEAVTASNVAGGDQARGAGTPDGLVAVVVELAEPPALEAYLRSLEGSARRADAEAAAQAPAAVEAEASAAAMAQLTRVERAQRELVPLLTGRELGATVLFTVGRVFAGVAIEIDPTSLDTVRLLPGVKAVHPLSARSPELFSSVPLINAPTVWSLVGLKATGEGLRVGVIDSGIDYLHSDFAGPGKGYGNNNTAVIGDAAGFPGAKVVGGWDFVGDEYNSGSAEPGRRVPRPDPDPMDCTGHGTHVAGITAGLGVNSDGSTYSDAYGPATPFASLRIGPGVAPKASLYALKVFGCEGTTRAVLAALDWVADPNGDGSFSDRLDVINMSIGCDYCYNAYDPETAAAERLAALGTVVVWSAGNDDDTTYITGGRGNRAIVVGASADSSAVMDGLRVNSPAAIAGLVPASASSNFKWEQMSAAVVGNLVSPPSQVSGCEAFSAANAALISGKIAFLDWTDSACGSAARADNAANAGAKGVIFAYNHAILDISIAGNARIPAMITTQDVGNRLKANLAAGVNVTLSKANLASVKDVQAGIIDTLASFSSRGPSLSGGGLKPDITAPGLSIFSAKSGSGTVGESKDGTSMSGPHVAGVMTLLRQLHPGWTVEELKALAMCTASHDLFMGVNQTPPAYPPQRVGAGRVDLQKAASAQVVAYDADVPGAVGVSFGVLEVLGSKTATKNVKVVNKGASSASLTLGYQSRSDIPGVALSFPDGPAVSVPAGGSKTFQLRLTATAAQMKHSRDATMSATQAGWYRHWLAEESGLITLTPSSGTPLRVPVYAAARPTSSMAATPARLTMTAATGRWSLALAGQSVNTGTSYPTDERALVTIFELQATSPDEARSTGVQNYSDVRYVGVAGDYKATVAKGKGIADANVWFAVATHAPWPTPNTLQLVVNIDTNGDRKADFYVVNASSTSVSIFYDVGSDAFASATCTASPLWCYKDFYINGFAPNQFNTVPFDTSVLWMSARASRLGLKAGASRFSYWVTTFDTDTGEQIDSTPVMTYDLARPGVDTGGLIYWDDNGATIPADYNRADYLANRSQGLLLLHHHNARGNQAQVLAVAPNACTFACTATVPSSAVAGTSVAFAATPTANGCAGSATYLWSFDDGSAGATSRTTTHAYAAAGAYTWTLTATQDGATCSKSGTIQVTAPPRSGPYLISSVAHAPGLGGTQWRTNVAAVNRNTKTATITLTFFPYAGGASIVKPASLAAGATVEWQDILVSLFKQSATASNKGSLKIVSSVPLVITSRTYNQVPEGTYGQYYPAVTTADALTPGQLGVIPHLKKNTSFRSNVGALNLSAAPCTVLARLYGASGVKIGNDLSRSVLGERYTQWDDVISASGAAGQDIAYATIEAKTTGCLLWAYGSVVDAATGDPTTVPVLIGSPAGPYLVSSAAHAPGVGGTQWRTNVAAVNRNQQAASLALTFLPYGGGTPLQKTASLAAGATMEWKDILVGLFGLSATTASKGSLEIGSTLPVYVTSRTYNQVPAGTYGQYYPAVTSVQALAAGQVGVIPQLKKNASFRSNIGALNLSTAPCTVRARLFGATGAKVGNDMSRTIGRYRYTQWDDIFTAASAGAQSIAYATIEVQTEGCLAWAYGSVVDANTGDPTTVPVLQ